MTATIYLIPTYLHESNLKVLPAYLLEAIEKCTVLFVENERTARRYLKQLKKEIVIDGFEWYGIQKAEENVLKEFRQKLAAGKTIGIISEAGCPGVADPGQLLIAAAQEAGAQVIPLVGPCSILLALMASGLNGQQFSFTGYLPIDNGQRIKAIKELETESQRRNSTQIFIETPYRNNQLLEALLRHCHPQTKLCVAVDITGDQESIQTKTIQQWQTRTIDLHKRPAIFLLKR
ncbi:SAM-dependent methyltransferase [Niabella drilacis]|uniref:16S rRNA (Cytidine1402-2'-O)-methyltransferase n=1 Tax=Niabella drilacis (strain DSM 25811 / CCM 8410 / CCUG 62505 / LMG 26954 / E90) TaxID=1285928 RepID=A0A1G7ASQ8_NIADE|nr:SAM-dependent methyltransferase [Niabella drilacis]SDE17908.1 16S rRNA (cytidine1402-2'-O)-methyltransferase [Niabella drilacis]